MVAAVDEANERAEAHPGSAHRERTWAASPARSIAVWGLAFKPRTDDMREAPALALIEGLLAGRGDACAPTTPRRWAWPGALLGERITLCSRSYEAVEGADALVVVTEWNEFREPDFERIKAPHAARPRSSTAATSTIRGALRELGFHYEGIGRR